MSNEANERVAQPITEKTRAMAALSRLCRTPGALPLRYRVAEKRVREAEARKAVAS